MTQISNQSAFYMGSKYFDGARMNQQQGWQMIEKLGYQPNAFAPSLIQ